MRDAFLDRVRPDSDIDIATDARPDVIERAVKGWADAVWLQGERFGTVGCEKDGDPFEITTFRAEIYRDDSRNPEVTFSDDIEHRPLASRLHDQRDGDRARRARAHRSARRARRSRGPPAAHAALAGDLVRRRSAAHVARGAVRRDARLRARRRPAARDRADARAAADHQRGADPRRAVEAAGRRRSVGRALADRAHEARRGVPARAERDGARAGSDPPAQGRARAHDRGGREDVAALEAAARRRCCTTSASPARAATGRRA